MLSCCLPSLLNLLREKKGISGVRDGAEGGVAGGEDQEETLERTLNLGQGRK